MIRKGNGCNNATTNSFFSCMKVEFSYPKNYQSIDDAMSCIFSYMFFMIANVSFQRAAG